MEEIIKHIIIPYLDHIDDIENVISLIGNKKNIKVNLVNCLCKFPTKYIIESIIINNNIKVDNSITKYLTGIHTLDLWCNKNITDEGLKYLTGIHTLNLWYNTNITDEGLKYIKGATYNDRVI